jgi:hypothetical protein
LVSKKVLAFDEEEITGDKRASRGLFPAISLGWRDFRVQ